MIAPVSTGILPENPTPQTATGEKNRGSRRGVSAAVGRQWFAFPDLSDEQRKAMNKARVMDTYTEIISQLNRRRFKGRTSLEREMAEGGCLRHLGVKGIARATGRDPKTTARHLKWLASAGLITVTNPNVTLAKDPATGRITANQSGRRDACVIVLTVNAEQVRPTAVRGNDAPEVTVTTTGDRGNYAPKPSASSVRVRGNHAPVFHRDKRNIEGTRPSSGESGRPRSKWEEEPREPRAFTGDDAARLRATRERLEREARERYTPPAPLRVSYLPKPETAPVATQEGKSLEEMKRDAIASIMALPDQHGHEGTHERIEVA